MDELIQFAKDVILSSLKMTVNQNSSRTRSHTVQSTGERDGVYTFHFLKEDTLFLSVLEVSARLHENTVVFSIKLNR